MTNGLDPDQDRHSVGPDLGTNCLHRLSAGGKSPYQQSNELKKNVKHFKYFAEIRDSDLRTSYFWLVNV